MKRISIFLFAVLAFAQTPIQIANPCDQQQCFFATQSATVAASGVTTLTVQQPANGARQVTFTAAIIQCPGQSFTVGQAQNGTGATATAGTATALLPIHTINAGSTAVTAAARVFTASNVGAGTAVAPALVYASGSFAVIDLSQRNVGLSGIGNNYSVSLTNTGAASCTGSIAIYWAEKI
jgi:hypothetical protein